MPKLVAFHYSNNKYLMQIVGYLTIILMDVLCLSAWTTVFPDLEVFTHLMTNILLPNSLGFGVTSLFQDQFSH